MAASAVLVPWQAAADSAIRFERVAKSGVDFVLHNAPTPSKRMIETMAGGLAVLDYDGDGRADLYFTNGADPGSLEKHDPRYHNRLYRNLGGLKFQDATEIAGVGGHGYSMGAAAADFDNDGHTDLVVTGVFRSTLYRNRGDGTFEDVTATSGIVQSEWAVAAGWFDFDNDSRLDLLVVNYADWSLEFDRFCGDRDRGLRVYCHPRYMKPIANRLYRNLGDGTFADVSDERGVAQWKGRGMSVAFGDFDGNGRPDAYITNDNLPNTLLLQGEDGTFTDEALLSGAALLDHGRPVASMGVEAADFDRDGSADLVVTALSGETFPLFQGDGSGMFRDTTVNSGLARATHAYSGWGVAAGDLDNDGHLDLFTANSHVNDLVEEFEPFPYRQPNTVFRGVDGKFEPAIEVGGPSTHRGAVLADLDGDGRLDAVVSALGEPAQLWRNVSQGGGNWVAIELEGSESNLNGLGTKISVAGQTRWARTEASYASSCHCPVHLGLGDSADAVDAVIEWPNGRRQVRKGIPVNAVTRIREAVGAR